MRDDLYTNMILIVIWCAIFWILVLLPYYMKKNTDDSKKEDKTESKTQPKEQTKTKTKQNLEKELFISAYCYYFNAEPDLAEQAYKTTDKDSITLLITQYQRDTLY